MATLLICLWSISNIFDTNTFCRSFCYFFLKVVKYDISYSLYIWISHNKGMLFFSYRIAQCLSGPYAVTVAKTTYAIINVLLKNLITKSLQQQPPQNRQQQQQKQQQRPLQQLPHPPPQLKVRQKKNCFVSNFCFKLDIHRIHTLLILMFRGLFCPKHHVNSHK